MNELVLVVDDEKEIVKLARDYLERAGFRVLSAGDGTTALAAARSEQPDLVVLDLNLPGMDGLDVCRTLRKESEVAIIMLTARAEETDRLIGLELGADDYITKPFDEDVLLAHIKAVLRRTRAAAELSSPQKPLVVGDLEIDPLAHTVLQNGQPVDLSPREFDLLHALALQSGTVIPTADLLAQVWGAEFLGQPQVIYVHIRWLREKLEENAKEPRRIVTVHGVGYKLVPVEP